jgi:transcriptional regulator with XRE-family HTH domain
MDHLERLAKNLRRERKRLGLSQEELALLANLHPTAISRYEHGARDTSMAIVVRLAEAMGVSVWTLVDRDPDADESGTVQPHA